MHWTPSSKTKGILSIFHVAVLAIALVTTPSRAVASTTLVPETAWTGPFRHNAIGADPSGIPYIYSANNLYKKTSLGWVYNSVPPVGGYYPSVLVDNANTIHAFYHHLVSGNDYHVYHAECDPNLPNGASCNTAEEIVTRPDEYPSAPEFGKALHNSSIEDIDGNLHLVYGYQYSYWGLFYTKRMGGVWSTPTRVHPGTPNDGYMEIDDVSVRLDPDGRTLHAGFNNRSDFEVPQGLYYGTKTASGNWVVEPVIQGSIVWRLSLVLDGNMPRIAYSWYNSSTGQYELRLATRGSGGVWTHEVLFTNATGGIQSIDAEIANGTLHVIFSHGSGSSDDFRPVYVTKELPAGVPTSQRVSDSGLTETAFVSMASGSSAIHISYNHNRTMLKYLRISIVATPANQPPIAEAGLDQRLECAGSLCPIILDGSGSSDPDSTAGTNDDIAEFKWYLNYDTIDEELLVNGEMPLVFFALGTHMVTLKVVDQAGDSDTDTVVVNIDPAQLTLVDLEKVDIKWPEEPGKAAKLKVHGNLALPAGVLPSEVFPVGTFGLDIAGQLGVFSQAVNFELKGHYGEKWQFRGVESDVGLDKFDIHFDGAKFKSSDTVELQTDFIGVTETALALDRKGTGLPVSLSVVVGGGASVTASIDAMGVVASSVPFENDEDEEVTFTLPFELTPEMEIELTVGSQPSQILVVGDYYTASNGRFQIKGDFDPGTLNGMSRPAEVEVHFALGAEGFPGSAVVTELEWKKLSEREWKAKLKD